MKAVNLLPPELRAARSSGGQTGGLVYVVLGVLAVLVVMVSAWAFLGKQIGDKKVEVAQLNAEATQVEARAAALAKYEKAAEASRKRIEEVRGLAGGRFEWAHALREVSRVLPEQAWLTSIRATTLPTASVEGGAPNPLRSSDPSPAIEIVGCHEKQDSVARLMAQLRGMDRVSKVALSSSAKADDTGPLGGGSGAGAASTAACKRNSPQFNLVVFFEGQGAAAPAAGATPGAPAAASTTPSTPSTGAPK